MTSGQGKNDHSHQVWLSERRKRITASNAGKIAKRRGTTKVRPLVKELLYSKFEGSTATRWGLLQEDSTNAHYLEEITLHLTIWVDHQSRQPMAGS